MSQQLEETCSRRRMNDGITALGNDIGWSCMIEYRWISLCIHAHNLQGYNSLLRFTIFALNYKTANIHHSRYIGNGEYIEGNREKTKMKLIKVVVLYSLQRKA